VATKRRTGSASLRLRLVGRVIADGDVLLSERISTLHEGSSFEVVGLAGEVTSA